MKRNLLIIGMCVISILMINCSKPTAKQTVAIDSTSIKIDKYAELNDSIRKANNVVTPTDLIKYYYGNIENNDQMETSVEQLTANQYLITLVEKNIKDDSIAEMMVVMKAKKDDGEWSVLDIDRKWKCWQGRGHSEYSSEPCF